MQAPVQQGYHPQQPYAQPPVQQGYVPVQQQVHQQQVTTVQHVQQQPMLMQPGMTTVQPVAQTGVVVVQQQRGNCPRCRNGFLTEDYSACGIILAILFFPIGILCCLAMREQRCTNCHATF